MFNWAYENHKISALPKWGHSFEKPTLAQKRKYRQQRNALHGKKLFTAEQIRMLLDAAGPTMKAMILLGINCGFGNSDIAKLPMGSIHLGAQMIEFPRPKTAQDRRAALWPETVKALRHAIQIRPDPADPANRHLVFLTKQGTPWVRTSGEEKAGSLHVKRTDLLSQRFRALMIRVGLAWEDKDGVGLNFYTLRHTYRTIADEVKDTHAIDLTMGHAIQGMAATYVQTIDDSRLKAVAKYVRSKVLGVKTKAPEVIVVSSL